MQLNMTIRALLLTLVLVAVGCDVDAQRAIQQPKSASGVTKASAVVQTDKDGQTVEQKNIIERLKVDNQPGSVKHLYIISPYSGDVLLYSTVRGKVTSGSKRLTPNTIVASGNDGGYGRVGGFPIVVGGSRAETPEVLGDDGAYGGSGDYIFWFDVRGVYHQHFLTGGQIVHVASQPMAVSKIVINVETQVAPTR
jgi:hypothetical protein